MKKFPIERPFGVIKGIRDKELTNLRQLTVDASNHKTLYFAKKLEELKLISFNDNNGDIESTKLLFELFSLLGSLGKLKDYSWESMIINPIFPNPNNRFNSQEEEFDVFVLMPFSNELLPVYEDHIKKVSTKFGYKCLRADDFFTTDSIVEDIWLAINKAKILVADCTGRNPNVFYEIGLAHTLGKKVILISQTIDDIPFDLRHRRVIVYEYTPRGMKEFDKSLRETIQFSFNEIDNGHLRRANGCELVDGKMRLI